MGVKSLKRLKVAAQRDRFPALLAAPPAVCSNPCPSAANRVRADPSPVQLALFAETALLVSAPGTTNGYCRIEIWPTSSAASSSSASGDVAEPRDDDPSTSIAIRATPSTHSPPSSAPSDARGNQGRAW